MGKRWYVLDDMEEADLYQQPEMAKYSAVVKRLLDQTKANTDEVTGEVQPQKIHWEEISLAI